MPKMSLVEGYCVSEIKVSVSVEKIAHALEELWCHARDGELMLGLSVEEIMEFLCVHQLNP